MPSKLNGHYNYFIKLKLKIFPIIVISHLADKELLYKSYLNDVIVSSLFIVKCKGNYRRWLFATYWNYDSNLSMHYLLTSVTIILLRVKLNKMLNMKLNQTPFKFLVGKNSQNEQTHATGKNVTMRKYEQSPYPLIKFLLFISIHKIESYWKY